MGNLHSMEKKLSELPMSVSAKHISKITGMNRLIDSRKSLTSLSIGIGFVILCLGLINSSSVLDIRTFLGFVFSRNLPFSLS